MLDLLPFEEISESSAEQVGGKGFSLARTLAAGLPVPSGFVVTADAYRTMNGKEFPTEFQYSLERAYTKLGGGAVAVRSSALGEDGTETSFAGQMTTILGVRGMPALIEAIQTCWTSLHTERAKAYRQQQGLGDNAVMAVVVQQLVTAEVAGVAFTHDPNDANGERMAIEAAWGLGEVVVSRRVTPDRYTVRFNDGSVQDRHARMNDVRITADGEERITPDLQALFCLSDSQLGQLAELGRKVEAFYGAPRDIEWA